MFIISCLNYISINEKYVQLFLFLSNVQKLFYHLVLQGLKLNLICFWFPYDYWAFMLILSNVETLQGAISFTSQGSHPVTSLWCLVSLKYLTLAYI